MHARAHAHTQICMQLYIGAKQNGGGKRGHDKHHSLHYSPLPARSGPALGVTLVDGESAHAAEDVHPLLHLRLVLGHQVVHSHPGLDVKHVLVLLVGEVRVHTDAVFQVDDPFQLFRLFVLVVLQDFAGSQLEVPFPPYLSERVLETT